jgi:hypothetical protein
VRIRVRLGAGLSRLADAPLLSIDLADDASVDDLPSVLPVVSGTHVEREQRLHAGDEVALLIPVAGGA